MEIIKSEDDTSYIEPSGAVGEALAVSENSPEFSTKTGLHQHVQVFRILECFVELDYEGTTTALHNRLFMKDVLLLLRVLDLE